MKRCMIFNTKKFNSLLSLLLVASFSLRIGIKAEVLSAPNQTEQMQKGKIFIFTPQTIIKTNLPKQASCLFELQRILRERFGQSAIMGGFRAKGNSVIELWTDPEIKGQKHYILDISANKLSIRGATQEAILYGLKTLDRILQGNVSDTTNRQIAPVRIDDDSGTEILPWCLSFIFYPINAISLNSWFSIAAYRKCPVNVSSVSWKKTPVCNG